MRVFSLVLLLLLPFFSISQQRKLPKSNLKFGDIKPADFEPKFYDVDTNAASVILADIGESKFEGNNKGFFSIVFTHHRRIRILNKNGFDDASFSISLYTERSGEEKLDDLEACTYNLENGKVVATKLDKSSVFKDKLNKYYTVRKFTFPNLKEGSILELRYKVITPYYQQLRSWNFQGSMPRLWSEYSVKVPAMFDYVLLTQGYHDFDIKDGRTTSDSYSILIPADNAYDRSEVYHFQGNVNENVWAVKDMPALKNEKYTTTLENHTQKIEFQLRSIRWPGGRTDDIMGSWSKMAEDMLKDEEFGGELSKNNSFFDGDINKLMEGASSDKEKLMRIYKFVRDNFTCNDHSALWMSGSLKKIYQSKSGNVADINLLLTAILKSKGFDCQPVILSTRDNGWAYELYPLRSRFNYVITRVKLGEENILLDASDNKLGFGMLPSEAYNGYARIIELPLPTLIDLSPDSLKESKITSVFIMNKENGKGMSGSFTSTLGNFESYNLREKLGKTSKEDFFKDIKKAYTFEVALQNTAIDSLKSYESPVVVKYDFDFNNEDDIIYFNPLLTENWKDNPFVSANRQYPVEMPYTFNEIYILNMEIPKGYKVDEVPKSTRVKLNDDEGMFEYIISVNETQIQFRSKVVINKAFFKRDDYETLRNFFMMVVKKQSEQVVFKKIN